LVLDHEVVTNFTTPGGGAVLIVKDPKLLQQKLANLSAASRCPSSAKISREAVRLPRKG